MACAIDSMSRMPPAPSFTLKAPELVVFASSIFFFSSLIAATAWKSIVERNNIGSTSRSSRQPNRRSPATGRAFKSAARSHVAAHSS